MIEQMGLFLTAFVANTLSALSGGGAGLLQFPILLFLGLNFTTALATHKIASVALGVGASIRHFRGTQFDRNNVIHLLMFGLPGVIIGAYLVLEIPERIATFSLGFLTLSLAVYSWRQPKFGTQLIRKEFNLHQRLVGGCIVFIIGVMNGSLTSGTGLFMTVWLVRHYGFDYKLAVAYTMIIVGLAWNGTGAITLAFQTYVAWDWLPALILGSVLGGFLGAHYSIKGGNHLIKRCFEFITASLGTSLLLKAYYL
jgi:hypothetical protein